MNYGGKIQKNSRRGWPFILLAAALPGIFAVMWWRAPRVAAPEIELKEFDPAVALILSNALAGVRAEPDSGVAWGRLGSALMHYDLVSEAEEAFQRAAQRESKEPRWPYLHGLLVTPIRPRDALPLLERAAVLAPVETDAPRLRLAEAYLDFGKAPEAEQRLEAMLRAQPDHAAAALVLARVRQRQGRLSECSNLVARCLSNPHTARGAWNLLANVRQSAGDREGAALAAERSAGLPPDAPWPDPWWQEAQQWRTGRKARLAGASALLDAGRIEQAVEMARGVCRDYPQDEEVWYVLGWALNQQQKFSEAESALREYLRRAPQSPKGYAQLAVVLLNLRRYTEAVEVLAVGVKFKPTWREFHSNLGFASVQLGREAEAIGHYREALACDPGQAATYLSLSELLGRRGDREEARRLAGLALKLEPENARAATLLQRWEPRP